MHTRALPKAPAAKAPRHVAILGMGPSVNQYTDVCKSLGGRHKYCDETWVINGLGDVLACDRVFHMDDVRIQQVRAAARPDSNIAAMLEWMKTHPGPIYTSRPHPAYPGLVPYPLEAVMNIAPFDYFNSTAAYAVAFAILLGVEKMSLYGMDFTYPRAHDAEKGRACVEFWLGIAHMRGIKIGLPKGTSLMDAIYTRQERFYGYDTLAVGVARDTADSPIKLSFTPTDDLPTAEEIEARYDHSKHPSPLVAS